MIISCFLINVHLISKIVMTGETLGTYLRALPKGVGRDVSPVADTTNGIGSSLYYVLPLCSTTFLFISHWTQLTRFSCFSQHDPTKNEWSSDNCCQGIDKLGSAPKQEHPRRHPDDESSATQWKDLSLSVSTGASSF